MNKMKLNTIYKEDCLLGMKRIPDNSIDTIITDPPYNINIAEWDTIDNYETWIKSLFIEFQRISKQQIIFFDYSYTKLFEEISEPYERFIWHREGGFRGKKIKKGYEPFYWYVNNGELPVYNRITEINPYAKTDKRLKPERTVSNVWKIPNLVGRKKEKVGHPTQKPIKLMNRIVEMTTNKGDIILDPFMGSGTTAIACLNTNRQYIGFELDETYHKISVDRINKHLERNYQHEKN